MLHRHLVERVAEARDRLRALEEQRQAPDVLVTRFGATVADAQRLLAEERADADRWGDALSRVAEDRGSAMVTAAEHEARVLRAMALWLLQVETPAPSVGHAPEAEPGPDRAPTRRVDPVAPVLVRVEARAS